MDRETIYNRWLEFALNLANVLDVTHARKERIKEEIKSFITMYSPDSYEYADKPILGWDISSKEWECIGTHTHEFFDKYEVRDKHGDYVGKFYNQLLSCIRAGLDVAVPDMNSGGVLGFSVGTIRAAYNDNIPQWLNEVIGLKGDEPADTPLWL